MSRYRSKGGRTATQVQIPYTNHEVKLVWNGIAWIRAYREVENWALSSGYVDDRKEISDEIGERGRFNSCTHLKRNALTSGPINGAVRVPNLPANNWPGSTNWTHYGQSNPQSYQVAITPQGWQGTYNQLPATGLSEPDWSSLVDQVGQQLDGHMVVGQNLLVDLMTITQTLGMFKNPFGLRKLGKTLDKLSLSKIAKLGASSYLEYKFGWENIYRDMVQLAMVWGEVRHHKEYLKTTAQKFVSCAARAQQTITNPSQPGFSTIGSDGVIGFHPKVTRMERVGCFSLDIQRKPAALCWSTFDQVTSRLGVRDVLTALWDVVPYSFIVDWFTHVNRVIRRQQTDFGSFDIRRMGYSYKDKWYARLDWTSTAYAYGGDLITSGSGPESCVQEKYTRIAGFPPNTSTVGLFGNLNKTQIAEGLALIVQRI